MDTIIRDDSSACFMNKTISSKARYGDFQARILMVDVWTSLPRLVKNTPFFVVYMHNC